MPKYITFVDIDPNNFAFFIKIKPLSVIALQPFIHKLA